MVIQMDKDFITAIGIGLLLFGVVTTVMASAEWTIFLISVPSLIIGVCLFYKNFD